MVLPGQNARRLIGIGLIGGVVIAVLGVCVLPAVAILYLRKTAFGLAYFATIIEIALAVGYVLNFRRKRTLIALGLVLMAAGVAGFNFAIICSKQFDLPELSSVASELGIATFIAGSAVAPFPTLRNVVSQRSGAKRRELLARLATLLKRLLPP